MYESDRDRWEAVIRRTSAADEHFFYAVTTTGIYCRPSCRARKPRRENVRFFSSRHDAVAAGFRPCRKCVPNQPGTQQKYRDLVVSACRLLERAGDMSELTELIRQSDISRHHFHRVFRAATGVTPGAYSRSLRDQRLRERLCGGAVVTAAIYDAGYESSSRFYSRSRAVLGMTPTAFRCHGQGETIQFAVGQCSLGAILVAATNKGICVISLGDDPGQLLNEFQDQFRNAELTGGDRRFESYVADIVGFVENPDFELDLPLDIRGTLFQQRVWQAVQAVPAGTTATYSEIAEQIGSPRAVRAVASACAGNRLAIAIPCHRVVRRDGRPSGYRWGIECRQALLLREQQAKKKTGG